MDRSSSSTSTSKTYESSKSKCRPKESPKPQPVPAPTILSRPICRPGLIPITTIGPGIIPKSTAPSPSSVKLKPKSSVTTSSNNAGPRIIERSSSSQHTIPTTSGPGIIPRAIFDQANKPQRNYPLSGPGILRIPIENTRTTNVVIPRSSTSENILTTKTRFPNEDNFASKNLRRREIKSNESSRSTTPSTEYPVVPKIKEISSKCKSETELKSKSRAKNDQEPSLRSRTAPDPRKVAKQPVPKPVAPTLPYRIIAGLKNSPRGNPVRQETPNCLSSAQSHLYQEFKEVEKELYLLNTKNNFQEIGREWTNIAATIDKLHDASLNLMNNNIFPYTNLNIDQRVWKLTIYDYVLLAREFIKKYPECAFQVSKFLDAVSKKGVKHFRQLLSSIEEKHPFTRVQCSGIGIFSGENVEEQKAVKLLYGRILISIGDTKRYNMDDKENHRNAMEEYEKSRGLDPTQGRVYHQMGIVALQRLDFVASAYYFTRADCCDNPADGSRQQLQIVYDEAHKSYQKVSKFFWFAKAKTPEKQDPKGITEIWLPKGRPIPPLREAPHTKETHFHSLKPLEIYRRFALTYTEVVGKMFTGVGMDTFEIVAEESLVYFEGLMNLKTGCEIVLPPLRMLQIMALNMHMVDNSLPKDIDEINKRKLPEKVLLAVQYTLEMFSLLAERLTILLVGCCWDDPLMETLTVGLFVCIEWMKLKPKLWARRRPRPLFSIRKLFVMKTKNMNDKIDEIWIVVAKMISKLEEIILEFGSQIFPSVSEEKSSRCKHSLSPLQEVSNLSGFPNFENSEILSRTYYTDAKTASKKDRARNFVRLEAIHKFGAVFLTTEPNNILQAEPCYNGINQYTSSIRVLRTKNESKIPGLDRCHYHFWVQNWDPDLSSAFAKKPKSKRIPGPDCNNSNRIIPRKHKTAKPNLPPTHTRMVDYEIWVSFGHAGFRQELVVQPRKVVLDTNCFVRHLNEIQLLLTIVSDRLYIPVIVLVELKGLAKGGLNLKDRQKYGALDTPEAREKYREGNEVARSCREALYFISKNMHVFIFITCTAKIINIRSPYDHIRDEVFDEKRRNDDRILDACKYMESRDTIARRMDCPHRIYRSTVLATGDRNLRLKTIGTDLPSRPIHSLFLWFACHHWTHIGRSVQKKIKDDNHKAYLKRKQRREQQQFQYDTQGRRGKQHYHQSSSNYYKYKS